MEPTHDPASLVYLLEGSRAELDRWRRDLERIAIRAVIRPKASCTSG
jgi:hypothetical protein